MTYYVYSIMLDSFIKRDDGSRNIISEKFKKDTQEWMQSNGVMHLQFIPVYEEGEEAQLNYEKRLRESYYFGTNPND